MTRTVDITPTRPIFEKYGDGSWADWSNNLNAALVSVQGVLGDRANDLTDGQLLAVADVYQNIGGTAFAASNLRTLLLAGNLVQAYKELLIPASYGGDAIRLSADIRLWIS